MAIVYGPIGRYRSVVPQMFMAIKKIPIHSLKYLISTNSYRLIIDISAINPKMNSSSFSPNSVSLSSTPNPTPPSAAAPMRWVLTAEPSSCHGFPCPLDTFCMRPADFGLPNYCVHRLAMQDVAQLLVQGPAMVYYEDIGQAVLAFLLALLLLVQFAHLLVYFWRSAALVDFYRQNTMPKQHQQQQMMSSCSMDTELRPLMNSNRLGDGHTNLTYETSSSAFEPSYLPFQQV